MDILELLSKVERLLKTRTPKMTKAEFYSACNITASAVSQWRNGKTQPALSTIDKMANVLGVSTYYLTGETVQADEAKRKLSLMVEDTPSLPSGERLSFLFDEFDYDPMIVSYNLDIDQTYIDSWMLHGIVPPHPIVDKVLGVFQLKACELLNSEELKAYEEENVEWSQASSDSLDKKAPTPVSEDGRVSEFVYLFNQLTDMEKSLVIAQIKGILAGRE